MGINFIRNIDKYSFLCSYQVVFCRKRTNEIFTYFKKRMLTLGEVDFDIVKLNNQKTVTESELKNAVKKYNLRDALLTIGEISKSIFRNPNMGNAAFLDKATGVVFTQDFLAYLTNILLISGANDFKRQRLAEKEKNVHVLCNIYHNRLVAPYLGETDGRKNFSAITLLTLLHNQQISHQKGANKIFGRNYYICKTLFKTCLMKSGKTASDIFFEESGMDVDSYFMISLSLSAYTDQNGAIGKEELNKLFADGRAQLPSVFSQENINRCFEILSANYRKLRDEDAEKNSNLLPIHTKGRFNPLKMYPIVKYDANGSEGFSIPSTTLFFESAFLGVYFNLMRHFERKNNRSDFSIYFGDVFNQYVGVLLKRIYGEDKVRPEIRYNKSQNLFVDWYVEFPDRFYLFEVKSSVFDLLTMMTGDLDRLTNEIRKKVVEAIIQIYKRVVDVGRYDELTRFRKKKIVPFVVFRDLPFISGELFDPIINEGLESAQESDVELRELCLFEVNRISIEELEACGDANTMIELDVVFEEKRRDPKENLTHLILKKVPPVSRKSFPEEQFEIFMKPMKE
jgi:hypothetical protein